MRPGKFFGNLSKCTSFIWKIYAKHICFLIRQVQFIENLFHTFLAAARNGHIFDHFAVEYEYPNGVKMFSQSRQINGCEGKVEEFLVGSKGRSNCKDRIAVKGGESWRYRGQEVNPYEQEHLNLINSIRAGNPINEARSIAESTLTGIMGRESAYSGQSVEWDKAYNSTLRLGPTTYEFGPLPVAPVAMPGQYKFV